MSICQSIIDATLVSTFVLIQLLCPYLSHLVRRAIAVQALNNVESPWPLDFPWHFHHSVSVSSELGA